MDNSTYHDILHSVVIYLTKTEPKCKNNVWKTWTLHGSTACTELVTVEQSFYGSLIFTGETQNINQKWQKSHQMSCLALSEISIWSQQTWLKAWGRMPRWHHSGKTFLVVGRLHVSGEILDHSATQKLSESFKCFILRPLCAYGQQSQLGTSGTSKHVKEQH